MSVLFVLSLSNISLLVPRIAVWIQALDVTSMVQSPGMDRSSLRPGCRVLRSSTGGDRNYLWADVDVASIEAPLHCSYLVTWMWRALMRDGLVVM